ncbi:hypothetical protein ACTQ45_11405 [Fundicoccus sp. Sow4_D5]|uniref:hypothetical protein n=1 Tax=Fundicoccus sp. Sow4_D5 TaxID=3438782 RepID=UPI003F91E6AC
MLNVGGIELTSEIAKSLDNDFDGDIITIFPVSETNEPVVGLLEITLLKHLN